MHEFYATLSRVVERGVMLHCNLPTKRDKFDCHANQRQELAWLEFDARLWFKIINASK